MDLTDASAKPALRVNSASVSFNGVVALNSVSLNLAQGAILGLIGGNGAGKTTLVNVLTGFQRPETGTVSLLDQDITQWSIHRRARAGLGRSFQGVRPFASMSVSENVEVAAVAAGTSRRRAKSEAREILSYFGLGDVESRQADSLSYGLLRKLAVARALAAAPTFLLLDEPAAGLNEAETAELGASLSAVRDDFSCGVLLIEHDVELVMGICDQVQVMVSGESIFVGPPQDARKDKDVLTRYFGADEVGGPNA